MTTAGFTDRPSRGAYDVVIVGGAIMGSATAWWLTQMPDFDGSVLVIERDPSYEFASTSLSNSCIRQQFSTELNIRISQFTASFIKDFRANLGGDPRIPDITLNAFGYLYLAAEERFAEALRRNQRVQRAAGAATEILDRDAIAARWPFYRLDDILLGSINLVDEGYWDGATVFDWLRRKAAEAGVEYLAGEVTGLDLSGRTVEAVRLASGERIACGQVVNAAGPRAAVLAAMAGLSVPVEPRKRYSWIIRAETPLDRQLPLTIDPSGVHVREAGGGTYLVGAHADTDPAVAPDDFAMDYALWEEKVWPAIANRIPSFEAVRIVNEWPGHYAYNTLDQNAIVGPHPDVRNFLFLNGFSGHGLQQAPAMGRGMAEWLVHGAYRSLDLSPFHYARILENRPILERAVI